MKKVILTLIMSFSLMLTIAADLYVNGSGNANTYTTIQGAVDAASSGDNIYVATVGTYSENVTISNKSLFIVAGVADETFTLSGSFSISPGIGNEVTIIGLYNGNITCSGSYGTLNLISSLISSINGSSFPVNVYDCEVTNSFSIKNGSVKGNVIDRLVINYGGSTGDTVRIMGNYMTSLDWNSSTVYFEICNNFINGVQSSSYSSRPVTIDMLYETPGGTNLFSNNTIDANVVFTSSSYGCVVFGSSVDGGQNLVIVNNYFKNQYVYDGTAIVNVNGNISNSFIANNQYYFGDFIYSNSNITLIDNGTSSVNWSYDSSTGALSSGVNMGLDQIEYRDIDNTTNDIGTTGGPHAWSNYNTTTGKAAIFNLELPFQLYIGGSHNIKAKGFHKN